MGPLPTTEETRYVGEGLVQLLSPQGLGSSAQGSLGGHPWSQVGGVTYMAYGGASGRDTRGL